jgi:CRP/FNR family transcriptional regulator, cyclic AMP receptor protein
MNPIMSDCHLVNKLTETQIAQFVKASKFRSFFKNEIIFIEGGPGESVFILLEGKVLLERRLKNKKPVPPFQITTVKHGQIFGEMGFLDHSARSATARAKGNVKLMEITSDSLTDLMKSDTDFGIKIMSNFSFILSKRLRRMNEQWLNAVSYELSSLEYEYQL